MQQVLEELHQSSDDVTESLKAGAQIHPSSGGAWLTGRICKAKWLGMLTSRWVWLQPAFARLRLRTACLQHMLLQELDMNQRQKISAVQSDVNKVSSCGTVKFALPTLILQAHDGLKAPGPQKSVLPAVEGAHELETRFGDKFDSVISLASLVVFLWLSGSFLKATKPTSSVRQKAFCSFHLANLLRRSSKTMRCLPGTCRHCWRPCRFIRLLAHDVRAKGLVN